MSFPQLLVRVFGVTMPTADGELSPFQIRRINDLAVEVNAYGQAHHVDQLVIPIGNDGVTVLAPGRGYVGNEQLYTDAMERFNPQLGIVLEMENPLARATEGTVATLLWNVPGVFRYRDKKPHFTLKNKSHSPVYFNCRELIKWPVAMNIICSLFEAEYEATCQAADVFAGGELAGVYFATWWAGMAHQSLATARKPKAHGIPSAIDGRVFEGDRVVLVEDLITDGGSKGPFLDGIEEAGGTVEDVFVVFDREQGGGDYLTGRGKILHAQVKKEQFLLKGIESGMMTGEALEDMNAYFENPKQWNLDHGYEWPEGL